MAHHTLHFETADVVVTSCRSILCRNLHSDGIQLHVGEHLLVKSHDNEIQVIQALQYFSLCHNRQTLLSSKDDCLSGLMIDQFTCTAVIKLSSLHHR